MRCHSLMNDGRGPWVGDGAKIGLMPTLKDASAIKVEHR